MTAPTVDDVEGRRNVALERADIDNGALAALQHAGQHHPRHLHSGASLESAAGLKKREHA